MKHNAYSSSKYSSHDLFFNGLSPDVSAQAGLGMAHSYWHVPDARLCESVK